MVFEYFFHWYVSPAPVLALRTTLSPAQNVVAPCAVITAVGNGMDVVVTVADFLVQPPELVTCTLYLALLVTNKVG
jgi:hypothetical protein